MKKIIVLIIAGIGFLWYKIDKNNREAWYRLFLEKHNWEYYDKSENPFERLRKRIEKRFEEESE